MFESKIKQCGGNGYTGFTCCPEGYTCIEMGGVEGCFLQVSTHKTLELVWRWGLLNDALFAGDDTHESGLQISDKHDIAT